MGLLLNTINYLKSPAILVGNGINLCSTNMISWNDLLTQIANVRINPAGLTNTEIFDFIELRSQYGSNLKHVVSNRLDEVTPNYSDVHSQFLNIAIRNNCPVLTTNFDKTLSRVGEFNQFRISNDRFTRYYPWETYFGQYQLNNPIDNFGVWHIHGVTDYVDSLRLGLTDYMGSVERARKFIHNGEDSLYVGNVQNNWSGRNTWLHIWFNKPLIIVGLSMKSDEVFIRWLLIERKKYFNRFGDRRKDTIYLSTGSDGDIDNFLYNLNIEHRIASDYSLLYC
jgi:hypothetical protein